MIHLTSDRVVFCHLAPPLSSLQLSFLLFSSLWPGSVESCVVAFIPAKSETSRGIYIALALVVGASNQRQSSRSPS
jgi:hypothetical protein